MNRDHCCLCEKNMRKRGNRCIDRVKFERSKAISAFLEAFSSLTLLEGEILRIAHADGCGDHENLSKVKECVSSLSTVADDIKLRFDTIREALKGYGSKDDVDVLAEIACVLGFCLKSDEQWGCSSRGCDHDRTAEECIEEWTIPIEDG